jgi:FtsX-like permease family
MTAHWVVLAAAALTTLVAAATGAALAAFAGQALSQSVTHDLVVAPGTSLDLSATVQNGDVASSSRVLKSAIGEALPGVPFGFWQASWSNPLGLVPGALPARPASAPARATPLLAAAAMQDVRTYAVLVSGHWPAAPPASHARGPVQAALPQSAAALLGVRQGDVLRLRDRNTGAPVSFQVTGLFAERRPTGVATPYWQLDSVPASGSGTAGGFTTYGPLIVDPAAFGAALPAASATWVAQPDMSAFTGSSLSAIAADQTALQNSLNDSETLSGVQLVTSLPAVLSGIGDNLAVARALLVICALQLLVLTVAATLAAARLLVTQRDGETALLSARGATRWQLTRLTSAEVIPLCVAAALAGGVAGVWLARFVCETVHAPTVSGPGGSAPPVSVSVTAAGTWRDALGAALVVAVIAAAAMLVPVLRSGPSVARARRGRQAAIAGATRAGADLALIVLAVLAGWQLRRYSAVTATGGAAASIDPVLALAPALALAGGTVVTLRLLPAAARATDRLAGGGRRLTASLAGWQFSRQPLRQGGAALLLVMAVATGTLALAQHQSWTRSAADQSANAAGADVRVNLTTPLTPAATTALTRVPGVLAAMPATVLTATLPSQIVAVDAATAPRVVPLRGDQSSLPPDQLFAALRIRPGTAARADVLPAAATAAFIQASKTGIGSSVNGVIDGLPVTLNIVAQVGAFPTVTGSALIVDLPSLRAFAASYGGLPLPVTQWWLATAGHRVPPTLAGVLPPGSAVTSRTALNAATISDPLSAAPQQALLAVAAAAAVLAVAGFWVSIAASVRQRRAENALLAALGVSQRSAAAQLFFEKLLLSVPAAALGLLLGTIVARLLVPAVTLSTTAQLPVPPPVTLFDLPQTIALGVAVAVLPALAAALVVFRRPDPAAELRAAES